jgi:hypothetical protein
MNATPVYQLVGGELEDAGDLVRVRFTERLVVQFDAWDDTTAPSFDEVCR